MSSSEGNLISASAVPHCGGGGKKERECVKWCFEPSQPLGIRESEPCLLAALPLGTQGAKKCLNLFHLKVNELRLGHINNNIGNKSTSTFFTTRGSDLAYSLYLSRGHCYSVISDLTVYR